LDTKLKRYNILFKVLALAMIAVLSCLMLSSFIEFYNAKNEMGGIGNLTSEHYTDTWQHWSTRNRIQSGVNTIVMYESKQNILDGNTVSEREVENRVWSLFENNRYYTEKKVYQSEILYFDLELTWEEFQKQYAPNIKNIKNDVIQEHLQMFENAVYALENTPNIYYYINVGGNVIWNKAYENIANRQYSEYQELESSGQNSSAAQWAYAFDDVYIYKENVKFLNAKQNVTNRLIELSFLAVLFLACMGYLIFAAGKKPVNSQNVHHIVVDKIYNEFVVCLLFLSGYATIFCAAVIKRKFFNTAFMFVLFVASVLLAVAFTLMLVRHIKSRTLMKHTLIFSVCHFIVNIIKNVYNAGPPMLKAFVLVTMLGLFTAIPFAFIITIPVALICAYIYIRKYITVKNGVKSIKSGLYNEKIEINGTGELVALAEDINDISAGLGTEVERRLKSERLKTELIVNVSHDIKTPLTSVITYVDLLKMESIDSENAAKYIDIIAKKSDRLKTLIDDLFDASKAASGNVTANLDEVDINALITQGLGELDDKIKASTLDFKINLPKEKITAYADGKLTWRVLENLLSNVFKYSLANSRVYIDVFEDEQKACISIKNISADELNIPEDEIMERFKRGDASRNSEGSGLGLDIAKSLMLCQNGELIVKIDGDLFKAQLKLPKNSLI